MFFKRCDENYIDIDGERHFVSNGANQDHGHCKQLVCEIIEMLRPGTIDGLEFESYAGWLKDLKSKLKEWDKKYLKH